MKSTKTNKSGVGGVQQFLIWHGEKIVVGVIAVVALWFAIQGLGYQTLTWQPSALEVDATDADTAIKGNTRTATDEGIETFDFATFATQIRTPISASPYRSGALWMPPPPNSFSQQTGSRSTSMDY